MAKTSLTRLTRILTGRVDELSLEAELDAGLSRLEHCAHFCVLVTKSFIRNRCPVRASALSYSTLLALIPMLAVGISVTSSLLKTEGEQQIFQAVDRFVNSIVPPAEIAVDPDAEENFTDATTATNAPAVVDDSRVMTAQKEAAKYIHEFIQNTRSVSLGLVGLVLLVLVAIRMIANIEATFNDIWGVARGRSWVARVMHYWGVITLGPLLLAGALGLAGGAHFQSARELIGAMPFISSLVFKLLPIMVIWVAFAFIYMLVPNTKVRFSAAMFGGVVAGSLWQLNNVFGFLYVSRVVSNSKIYGSLGLVPVFMAGLYLSWLILLFGAQIAYAFQNRAAYLQEKIAENVNQRGREFVALRLMTFISQRFQRGFAPATVPEMSAELGIPSRLTQQVLGTLLAARLVVEIHRTEPAYAPARPLDTINAHHVLMAMRAAGGQELLTRDEPARAEVVGEFARIQEAERVAATAITMIELVGRAEERLKLAAPKAANEATETKALPAFEPPKNQQDWKTY